MGSSLSMLPSVSFRVTPVLYAFSFTSIAFFIKYVVQEVMMVFMSKERDQEPHLFEDIRRANLDDIPKNWNNKRSTYERLRRIKKEDFETLVMFFFIVVPFLIFTDGGVNSNYTVGSTGIVWSDLAIVNSVFGCLLILAFPILRIISTALTFVISKTLVQNVMRIVTFAYFGLFILYSFIMIFVFNYVPAPGTTPKK